MAQNMYSAIFFDLDGTLLPMEVQDFLDRYFDVLGRAAAAHGYEPATFCRAVGVSVGSMTSHAAGMSNEDAFWDRFEREWGKAGPAEERFFEDFYGGAFDEVGKDVVANPAAARAVETLDAKGYPLYLTTMPMFPREAVEARLRWAGVDPAFFRIITTYDNSTACKPSLDYYRENVRRAGAAPQDILMVGNNTEEDLDAMQLGMDAFLVTDYLIDPNGFDVETVKHGSLAQFAQFAEILPNCPAGGASERI